MTDNTPDNLSLALELNFLNDLCLSWQAAWTCLPDRLRRVESYLEGKTCISTDAAQAQAAAVLEILLPLLRKCDRNTLEVEDVVAFAPLLAEQIAQAKTLPAYRAAGSLYGELHGRLENVTSPLVQFLDPISVRVMRCRNLLTTIPDGPDSNLDQALAFMDGAARGFSASKLCAAGERLSRLVRDLPIPHVSLASTPPPSHRRWLVISIEDDLVWQQSVARSVNLLKQHLEPHYDIIFEPYTDRASGTRRFKQLTERPPGTIVLTPEDYQPLAVLDMGILRSPGDTASPSRDEGLELLKLIRASSRNIPALVLTMPSNFLADQATAAGLGISGYLLKGLDPPERLIQELKNIITTRPRRKLKLRTGTGRRFLIDDVEISLDPSYFRTLSVLVDEAPRAMMVEEIVGLLQEKFGGYQNLATPSTELSPHHVNCRNFWGLAREAAGDSVTALAWLRDEQFALWKSLSGELKDAGITPDDEWALSRYMTEHYGTLPTGISDFDPRNIAKHIHEIRKCIIEKFNAVGRMIFPAEEIISSYPVDGEWFYKFVAEVEEEEGDDAKGPAFAFRILILENDLLQWRDPVEKLLLRFGFVVDTACCEEEAIEKARRFRPHLLCLDMLVPPDLQSFEQDPEGGDADAGLNVLRAVTEFLPEVRALIFSDLTDHDALRNRAFKLLGVQVTDFVAKNNRDASALDAELILKVLRVEREVARQAIMPLPYLPQILYIKLFPAQTLNNVEVFGKAFTVTGKQFQLLCLLAQNAYDPVPTVDLMEVIYGPGADDEKTLFQLVRNLRNKIAQDWLGIPKGPQAKLVSEAVLASDAKAGYILNARTEILN